MNEINYIPIIISYEKTIDFHLGIFPSLNSFIELNKMQTKILL